MQARSIDTYHKDHLSVITLKRTPERLENFFKHNKQALDKLNVHIIEGVDGVQQRELFKKSRLISKEVLYGWSPGAIGSALSHMLSWRLCIQLNKPIIVAEDDAVLAKEISQSLAVLLRGAGDEIPFLLLGWNLDSLLQAELWPGLGLISLFEPAYPKEEQIEQLVNCKGERRICKLKRCFGLPAYRITPRMAKYLLESLNPLTRDLIPMGRGIPTNFSQTLDGVLNNQYEIIGAKVIFPPLALAINDQKNSLTKKSNIKDFKG